MTGLGPKLTDERQDEEKERISIDCREALERAIARHDAGSDSYLKLHLVDPNRSGPASSSSRPVSAFADMGVFGNQGHPQYQNKHQLINELEHNTHFSRRVGRHSWVAGQREANNGVSDQGFGELVPSVPKDGSWI